MSKAMFWQNGNSLDYKNTTSAMIEANTIIRYGDRLGVIGGDIEPGKLGAVIVSGAVFEMPKSDTTAIAAGKEVFWDGNGITATSSSSTIKAGFAAQEAAASDEKILVSLNA